MVQLRRELAQVEKRLNVTIERDSSAEENLITLAMKFPPASLSNGQLRELAPYGSVFSKLSLVASGIGDEGLYQIGKMPNVKALFLQKTKLNGTGLIHLRGLENLEVLNLSFTSVDDKAALDLLKIPNLREVYLYRTKVSPEVVRALQEYRPTLKILLEEGPYL
jgi:Leucine-rich repeat (LRR) protein